ncbi:MAG: hypothetical protein ACT4PL_09140, partial [Phycisphaerales bacterium]
MSVSALAGVASLTVTVRALAQPVMVTTPTTVGPTATMINGVPLATALVTVQGTTLTISGSHTIAGLAVVRNGAGVEGVVTHPAGASFDSTGDGTAIIEGLDLTVAGDLFVEGVSGVLPASRIDVTGRGFGSSAGPGGGPLAPGNDAGGGSHGGNGGPGLRGPMGVTYGSVHVPARLGSGGGAGGFGGGRLRLAVQGTATVDGQVLARGGETLGGGGAGGAIHIIAGNLGGSGLISADGGASSNGNRGGGGGGRIAVYSGTSTFVGVVRAFGGFSGNPAFVGGAGTVYTRTIGEPGGTITIEGSTLAGEAAIFNGEQAFGMDVLHVRSGGKVSHDSGQSANLTFASVVVDVGGAVDVSRRGFGAAMGPGGGPNAPFDDAGGAAHGGNGGDGTRGPGGLTYG